MKYIKLYFKYIRLSIMSKLSYKASSILGICAFLLTEVASIATLFLIVSTVPSLEGYTFYEIGILYAFVNMAIGIHHLFTDRLWTVKNGAVPGKPILRRSVFCVLVFCVRLKVRHDAQER